MTVTAYIPLLVFVLGLLLFFIANREKNPDAKEIGRAMLWCGLLVSLLGCMSKVVHLP